MNVCTGNLAGGQLEGMYLDGLQNGSIYMSSEHDEVSENIEHNSATIILFTTQLT